MAPEKSEKIIFRGPKHRAHVNFSIGKYKVCWNCTGPMFATYVKLQRKMLIKVASAFHTTFHLDVLTSEWKYIHLNYCQSVPNYLHDARNIIRLAKPLKKI